MMRMIYTDAAASTPVYWRQGSQQHLETYTRYGYIHDHVANLKQMLDKHVFHKDHTQDLFYKQ